jgi:hypothetical protein
MIAAVSQMMIEMAILAAFTFMFLIIVSAI